MCTVVSSSTSWPACPPRSLPLRPAPPPSHSPALQLTTCCFDKTGTLTSDHMVLEGVAGSAGREAEMVADVKTLPSAVCRVLACCQSLLQVRSVAQHSVGVVGTAAARAGWSGLRGEGCLRRGSRLLSAEGCGRGSHRSG